MPCTSFVGLARAVQFCNAFYSSYLHPHGLLFLGVSWKCTNFGCFRKFKSFQKKKKGRFVEFCSWPWPFTLIGTGCRTCWLPRNLFDKTLLHSQSSRSFSRYLKPNYSNEACPRTHCRYIGYFGSPRAMVYAPQKINVFQRENVRFRLEKTLFRRAKALFQSFSCFSILHSWVICFVDNAGTFVHNHSRHPTNQKLAIDNTR